MTELKRKWKHHPDVVVDALNDLGPTTICGFAHYIGVHPATARNYLNELIMDGRIEKQTIRFGHGTDQVIYQPKKP